MYQLILTRKDNRLSSVNEIQDGSINQFFFDDPGDFKTVLVSEADIDYSKDLKDYRFDEETGTLVYDPVEEPIEYVDLETGEQKTMTSADIDALVDEKVRNNVMAVLQELASEDEAVLHRILNP